MGLLVYAYYMSKLFTKATDLAKKYVCQLNNEYYHWVYLTSRMSVLKDLDELSRASCCLPKYIHKGIAMATFILGRCLQRGLGIKQDTRQAEVMYKKVDDGCRSLFVIYRLFIILSYD
jgi:TPR repeat protein